MEMKVVIDVGYKIGVFLLSLCSSFFTIRSAIRSRGDSRRASLIRVVILDQTMPLLYKNFEEIYDLLETLKRGNGHNENIEVTFQSLMKKLNTRILSVFSIVDNEYYQNMLEASDQCRDKIINSLADEGLNLNVEHTYDEHIQFHVNECRKQILELVYNINYNKDNKALASIKKCQMLSKRPKMGIDKMNS
jgi:hypothetical protein